jgi:hypothetical protein
MPEELLERPDLHQAPIAPEENLVPPVPPEGLDTALYELDERAARADLRRQIAAMELALVRLFGSAFPRKGIDFAVAGLGGPRMLSVDELERVRDSLAARIQEVRSKLHEHAVVEEANRELIERMGEDPASYKWVRVQNEDIGEPGCKNWHATPKWGPLGLLLGWWRVKISSGCPLAEGLRPPDALKTAATKEAEAPHIGRGTVVGEPGAGSERYRDRADSTPPPPRKRFAARQTGTGRPSLGPLGRLSPH